MQWVKGKSFTLAVLGVHLLPPIETQFFSFRIYFRRKAPLSEVGAPNGVNALRLIGNPGPDDFHLANSEN